MNSISSGGSRLQFLEELSSPKGGAGRSGSESAGSNVAFLKRGHSPSTSNGQDIWCSPDFALKLAPPTIDFDGFDDQ